MTSGLIVLFCLFFLGGACSSYIVSRCAELRDRAWVQVLSLVFFLVVLVLLRGRLFIFVAVGCALYAPLFAYAVGGLFDIAKRRALGDHRLAVQKTYDKAEAAEKKRDYGRALRIYDQALTEDPDDHEAMRRKGELYLVMGRIDDALGELRRVYGCLVDPEQKATVGFRIVDLLVAQKNNPESAKTFLTELVEKLAGTRFSELARARLSRLLSRQSKVR